MPTTQDSLKSFVGIIDSLRRDLGADQATIQALQGTVAALHKEVQQVKKDSAEQAKQHDKLKSEVKAAKASVAEQGMQIQQLLQSGVVPNEPDGPRKRKRDPSPVPDPSPAKSDLKPSRARGELWMNTFDSGDEGDKSHKSGDTQGSGEVKPTIKSESGSVRGSQADRPGRIKREPFN